MNCLFGQMYGFLFLPIIKMRVRKNRLRLQRTTIMPTYFTSHCSTTGGEILYAAKVIIAIVKFLSTHSALLNYYVIIVLVSYNFM